MVPVQFLTLKRKVATTVKTIRVITSCIIFSSKSENGPPFSLNPILFAGTMKQYSNSAIPHDTSITANKGQLRDMPVSCSLRWPYQANVMNILETTRSATVIRAVFISSLAIEIDCPPVYFGNTPQNYKKLSKFALSFALGMRATPDIHSGWRLSKV